MLVLCELAELMRIPSSTRGDSRGSTLFVALFITGLVALAIGAYLSLLFSQNTATARSQAWNAAIPVIEAGVEEALAHLNAHGSSNLVCDGWSQSGNVYWVQRSLGANYYLVTISNWVAGVSNNSPVVESRGYMVTPNLVASSQITLLADVNAPSAPGFLARGVRVTTRQEALFSKGLVAKGQIDLKGNNIATDSFDSTDPAYSTNGRYDATKDKANGDVATDSVVTNSLSVGNANIMGHISTGPGGVVDLGPNGSVGDKNWFAAGSTGIQPGWSTDDMNVDFPDAQTPGGTFFTPAPGLGWTYLLPPGNYRLDNLTMSGSKKMLITAGSTVVLYVAGNVSMSGQAFIQIDPGATLKLYVGGASASFGGQGIVNSNANAQSFYYYGLPSNTGVSMSGNAAFTGVIYAPGADLTLGGGGTNTYDFVGASISKTVTMNGHYNFHYDEALATYGPSRGFVITSWNEMAPQDVASLPQGIGSPLTQ